ncbi:hypothetical protein BC332_03316 [Capsicum chinense]|nr:hypothetical protein BC332_03316 [Capsicum chinense]
MLTLETFSKDQGQRLEYVDAKARQRGVLPSTIKETIFHKRIDGLGIGPPIHAGLRPELIGRSARRRTTFDQGSSIMGLSPSLVPHSRGLGPDPPLKMLLQSIIQTTEPPYTKDRLFLVRSLLLRYAAIAKLPTRECLLLGSTRRASLGSKKKGSALLSIHEIRKMTLKVVVFQVYLSAPIYTTPLKSFYKVGLELRLIGFSFPADSAKPVPLDKVSLDNRQGQWESH